jgi:threonyl-tRNA synthetase
MPQRYAETTMVYRDEQSGELGGLTRVLSITQDDAHVFCRTSQMKEELLKIWDIVDTFYQTFGFTLRVRFSFRDPDEEPEKYLGTPEIWNKAEAELRAIAEERGIDVIEGPGEAALYGPKLDFMAQNAAGREWQVATIQLDMNIPERLDLVCINEKGEKERIVMIHAAIAGSLERAAAVLIEHYAGAFPLWLSPVQIRVLTVSDGQREYGKNVHDALAAAGIRAEFDDADESLGKKIRAAKTEKLPYFLVLGDKEVESQTVTLESRDGTSTSLSSDDLLTRLTDEIKTKKA